MGTPQSHYVLAMMRMNGRRIEDKQKASDILIRAPLFLCDSSSPKTLLLFVIRDHLGKTSLSDLQKTLCGDLKQIWAEISKVGTWFYLSHSSR
jgi:hypothetical protein